MTAAGLKCIFNGRGGCLTKQQMFDLIGTKSQSFNLQKRKFDLLFLIKCLACKCIMVLISYSPFFLYIQVLCWGIYVQYLLHLLFSIKKRPHPVRIILHLLCVICIHVFMETIRVCSEKQQIYFLGQQTQVIWSTKFSECKLTLKFFSNILTYLLKNNIFSANFSPNRPSHKPVNTCIIFTNSFQDMGPGGEEGPSNTLKSRNKYLKRTIFLRTM